MLNMMLRAIVSVFTSRQALVLENLALRHQIQVLQRSDRRPRLNSLDRGFWVILSRIWTGWRNALVVVKPETVLRWHREGFRLYWKRKSRVPGRPRAPKGVRDLVRCMARENPLWGAPRIHGELLKLVIDMAPATVSKYLIRPRRPPSQAWRTFLKNHAKEMVSVDFFTVPTATFKILYVFLVLSHERRRVVHINVTDSPTALWTGRQIVQAFPWDTAPRFLLRDRDSIHAEEFRRAVRNLRIADVPTAPHSPWQNPYVERWIGSIRRECLAHVIILNEGHLWRVLREYVAYDTESRTHLGLGKDCPEPRAIEPTDSGEIVAIPMVGGLHHRYTRRAA